MNWKLLSLAALGFMLTGCWGEKEEKKADEAKPAEVVPAPAPEGPKADMARPVEPAVPAETPAHEEKKPE